MHTHPRADTHTHTHTHTDVTAVLTHLYRETGVLLRHNTAVFPRGDVTIMLLLLRLPLLIKKVTPTTCHFTMTDDAMC